ncbi:sigma-70 family RNA polymerase sigma factor [Bacteroidetes/Chlorobi group bacterium MS-B_bin-24]|jgi:RNA polymerase sigma-70 factor (ECF subfamily)|nr:MAG: sigma-70 family RNA polymerase sigma factor [Bacteroidetes/Chlorobi group bacterium MS-B_bin-24]
MIELAINLKTDREIIEEYSKGNIEQATNEFVRRYKNFIYLVAYRYVRNYDDAEDITQEVFIDALRKLKDFRQESSLKTWLYRITVNKAKNLLRRRNLISFISFSRPEEDNDLDFPDHTQSNKLENKELEEKFLEVLASLPEKQREVFSLRYFEDLSFNEISEMLGTSVGGLKANYFHAVRKIASEMKKYLEE